MPPIESPAALEDLRKDLISKRDPKRPCVTLCSGSACHASGSADVATSLEEELEAQGLSGEVDVRKTGCHGFCERGPIIVMHPEEVCYLQIEPADVPEIVSETLQAKKVVERLLYADPTTGERVERESDIPFYKHQERLVFGGNGSIDPKNIEDYVAVGGYAALARALSVLTPEQVLDEVKRSGLRGRGGGGFPAGRKWEEARHVPGETKYVIVNADEGDPGAYMDRSLLEGNPHAILEGLTIGAYAVGAHEGYIYVRQEYPLAVENVHLAIQRAEEYGLLGKNILGSGFDFTVTVHQGAGAFVCGESSALMTALEGRVGEPRSKYIHTAVKGVWDRPSVLNNVETWANVPMIINRGAEWFTQFGTEKSKGTKIFSLVGKITNTGLVEVPMGMTLREIIYDIGGGIPGGKKFKAVQTGGPSGGCIPEEHAGPASGLRRAHQGRFDDGVGRDDRHGRGHLHGRRRPVLHRLPDRRIVRQVRPVPRGHAADAQDPDGHHQGQGKDGRSRTPGGTVRGRQGGLPLRPGQERPQPVPEHAALLPGRVRGAHQRETVPGPLVQGVDCLPHRPDGLSSLHDLCQELPGRRDRGRPQPDPRDRPRSLYQVRDVLRSVPRPVQRREEALGRAGSASSPRRRENRGQKEQRDMSGTMVQIDGREVEAREGMTILEAAQLVGIEIPTLCYHEKLEPHGGCRLCTVEVEVRGWPRLVAACVYPVEDGLVVRTRSDKIDRIRKMILELLLAHAPDSPELLEFGRQYGADRDRFEKEASFCIHCGLCVRYCAEVKGANAVGFVDRGARREISFIPEIAARECWACKECFPLCPTSALQAAFVLVEAFAFSPQASDSGTRC